METKTTRTIEALNLAELSAETTHYLQIPLVDNALGQPIFIPVIVIKGKEAGPTLGITAAVHGNELNGIPIIHRLTTLIDASKLSGNVVLTPVVNVPGYLRNTRAFRDGQDLNRVMPGKHNGNEAQVYVYQFVTKVISKLDYLIDLHTASFGRANALYVRADMTQADTAAMARLMGAQIIVHNEGSDGTLRAAAADLGIHAITLEVGDPNRFQRGFIKSSRDGIELFMHEIGMLKPKPSYEEVDEAILCTQSYWTYTDRGGILEVFVDLAEEVNEGQRVARVSDIHGRLLKEYFATEDTIVVGKSVHPVAYSGARIIHFGVVSCV